MLGSFGWMELLLILFIVLIIFGAGKLPQLGEGLGKAIKGFKQSVHEPDVSESTDPNSDPSQLPHSGEHEMQSPGVDQNDLSTGSQSAQGQMQATEPVHKS
jgi:sec-independent protein translocase protein TatA